MLEIGFMIMSAGLLYVSIMGQKARQTLIEKGEQETADLVHLKSNSYLFWSLGWGSLALFSLMGISGLAIGIGAVMFLAFLFGL